MAQAPLVGSMEPAIARKGKMQEARGEKHLRAPGVGTQNQRLRFHLDHSQVSVQLFSSTFGTCHMAEVDEKGEDTGKGNVGPHRQVDV